MKFHMRLLTILLVSTASSPLLAKDDRKEVLQDLICELGGTAFSVRDGVSSQKIIPKQSVSIKVARSIESWNQSKRDMDIIMTPRGNKLTLDFLSVLGRFNKNQVKKNVWYGSAEDTYMITQSDDDGAAPTSIEQIKIDKITGDLYYSSAMIGTYSELKVLSGKCIPKEKARVLN